MSKVIFKMTFKHPNFKDTANKNAAHVNYIATRAGVDKTLTESDLKKELEKGIDNAMSEDEDYIKYVDERPRSHGLFGQDGVEDPEAIQREIRQVNSFVWRGIISLKEDDAIKLGYLSKDQWQDMLRKKMPDMAKEMGIPITNLKWVGAIHMEKGHPHAHVILWEKEPKKTVGIINSKNIENIRKHFTDEIFEEERFLLLNEKNIMRELLRDLADNDISQASKLIKEIAATGDEIKSLDKDANREGVAPKLHNDIENELIKRINALSEIMPGKGRIALKFMPENVKEEVKGIADYLLSQPEYAAALERELKAAEGLTRLYTSDDPAIKRRTEQYKFITSNMANAIKQYGLDDEKTFILLRKWTDEYRESINLPPDVADKILDTLKKSEVENSVLENREKTDFNILGLKLLENAEAADTGAFKEKLLQEVENRANRSIKDLLEKDMISVKDGIYTLSEAAARYFEQYESLKSLHRELLTLLNRKDHTIEELLANRKIKFLLDGEIRSQGEFSVKKYDATIIKDYFGKENRFNIEEFKKILAQKYKSEEKQNEEYNLVTKRIEKLVENGIVEKTGENYSFTNQGLEELKNVGKEFVFTSYDANVICNYIDRAGGYLTKEHLRSFLQDEYQTDEEIKKQLIYLMNRLEKNVSSDYVSKIGEEGEGVYSLTEKGMDAREQILNPHAFKLNQYVKELMRKGILSIDQDKILINENYKEILQNQILANIKNGEYDFSKAQQDIEHFKSELLHKISSYDVSYDGIKQMFKLKDIENPIQRARNNAYNDIRDRICQTILKGATESQRQNIFYIDQKLSEKAVSFIKDLSNQINLIPEQEKVLNQITIALMKNGYGQGITGFLVDYAERENLTIPKDAIEKIVKDNLEIGILDKDTNPISSGKKIDHYLSALKLIGKDEKEAFQHVKNVIKKDSTELEKQLKALKDEGILKKTDGLYNLTNKGVEEFLKIKDVDRAERAIYTLLEEKESITFKELLDNGEVFSNLYDKDPEEFKLGKFDNKIREDYFHETESISLKELESNIYEKYTDKDITQVEKAEKEIDIITKRLEKLCLNGYMELDKEKGMYSLTNEAIAELENLKEKMEFTRYDASVTLSYIDKAENGTLTAEKLNEMLHDEITNQTAKTYYERFMEVLESDQKQKYISIDESGTIISTEEGKWLGINLNKLNKYFFETKGSLTEEKLKSSCIQQFGEEKGEKQFQSILKMIKNQVEKGHITIDKDTGIYRIDPTIQTFKNLLYQVHKEGGFIQKDELKEILERNIPNKEAESQFKYITKRLENLKDEGYLEGEKDKYILTDKGTEKREDLLIPQREVLRKKLQYLSRLGLLENVPEGYKLTEAYKQYMSNIATAKKEGLTRESDKLTKGITKLLDQTQDNINVGKIERTNLRTVTGKYINGAYEDINSDYQSMRDYNSIADTTTKTIKNLATTLLVSGVGVEEAREILQQWNIKSNSNIDTEKINELVNESNDIVSDNNKWDKITVIGKKEWDQMFQDLGVDKSPKWIYKGENWKDINLIPSIINDIWKSTWATLERQRMQTEAQAEMMKKQLNKQQAASQSKEAMKEQARKNKDRGALYHDEEELER